MRSQSSWLPLLVIVSLPLLPLLSSSGCTQLAGGRDKEVTALRGDVAVPFVFRTVSVQQPVNDAAGIPTGDPLNQPEPQDKGEQADGTTKGTADSVQAPATSPAKDVLADVYPKSDQAPPLPLPTTELASSAPPATDNKEIFPDPAEVKKAGPEPAKRTGRWVKQRVGLFRWRDVWVSDGPQSNASSTNNRKDGGHSSSSYTTRSSCANGVCGR